MLTKEDKTFISESLPFFNHLHENEINSLFSSIIKTKFDRKKTMHSGLDDCSGLFLVRSGMLRAYIVSENGKELTVYRLLTYDICIFSATCILKNIAFDIMVDASENSEVYIIPSKVFDDLAQKNIKVLEFANNLMQGRFSEVMESLQQTIFLPFEKRLALYLLDQINIQGSDKLILTHEEIANDIASAREVVTRMLKEFEIQNVIKIHRGKIDIINILKLREKAI